MTDLAIAENFSFWRRSYIVKPIEEIEQNRMSRSHVIAGMPYLSFKASEMVKMAYAMKVISRNNTIEALYRVKHRSSKTEIDLANKTLRDLLNKDYLELNKLSNTMEHLYILGNLGFQYIGRDRYNTDFPTQRIVKLYYTNQMFNVMCRAYKDAEDRNSKGIIEWVTEPEFSDDFMPSAACIIWEDKTRRRALEARIFETLEANFPQDQIYEAGQVVKKYERLFAESDINQYFPISPSVYLVIKNVDKEPLKAVEDGKMLVGDYELNDWAML